MSRVNLLHLLNQSFVAVQPHQGVGRELLLCVGGNLLLNLAVEEAEKCSYTLAVLVRDILVN